MSIELEELEALRKKFDIARKSSAMAALVDDAENERAAADERVRDLSQLNDMIDELVPQLEAGIGVLHSQIDAQMLVQSSVLEARDARERALQADVARLKAQLADLRAEVVSSEGELRRAESEEARARKERRDALNRRRAAESQQRLLYAVLHAIPIDDAAVRAEAATPGEAWTLIERLLDRLDHPPAPLEERFPEIREWFGA